MSAQRRRIRVIVVDDEAAARDGVVRLASADPELEVVASCSNGRQAIEAIRLHAPDLVLLDIQMPQMDGFEVVGALDLAELPVIVFITAFDQFAIRAFEVHAVDYILKPFDDDRFRAAMNRAKHMVRNADAGRFAEQVSALLATRSHGDALPSIEHTASAGENRVGPLTRLVVKSGGRITLLRVDEIDWIEAADYCVRIHSRGRSYMIRESMSALEARLTPERFSRVHRSAIVNLDRVYEIQSSFHGEHVIILRDGTKLLMNRSRRARLEALLSQRL